MASIEAVAGEPVDAEDFPDRFRFLRTVPYTTSSTFTMASYDGIRAIRIRLVGGGGGGGGCAATGATQNAIGQSGGGGVYAEKWVDASSLSATETVTVGTGGTGGSAGANNGNPGNPSSVGAHCSANGGLGGQAGAAANVPTGISGTLPVSTGTGDRVEPGGGTDAVNYYVSGRVSNVPGGRSKWGEGGEAQSSATGFGGSNGKGYGGGGSGGANDQSEVTARAGGNGADGRVEIEVWV